MNLQEEWRPVVGFPGYEVSSTGRVLSRLRRRPIVRSPHVKESGHLYLLLRRDGRRIPRSVHSLVLEAFVGPRPQGLEIRHLDGDPANNNLDNLAYGTHSENVRDSVEHGTHSETRKTHCIRQHPFDADNTRLTRDGRRECRACRRFRVQRRALRAAWAEDVAA